MNHLTDEQLSALVDGALAGGARAAAERHLEGCASCRETLAGLVAQDHALRTALGHDPGDAYFEDFAARVGGRIRAAGLKGAQARVGEARGLADWFRSPRKLAVVGVLATAVVGAGIVMLAAREVRLPALRGGGIESRIAQEEPPVEAPGMPTAPPLASAPVSPPAATPRPAGETRPPASMADRAVATTAAPQAEEVEKSMAARPPAPAVANEPAGAVPSAEALAPEVARTERAEPVAPLAGQAKSGTYARGVTGEDAGTALAGRAQEAPATAAKEQAAAGRVCGSVRDERGRPVSGARVVDRATGASVASAADGSFCLESAGRETRIAVMAVGFRPVWRDVSAGRRADIALAAVPVLDAAKAGRLAAREEQKEKTGAADAFAGQPTFTSLHGRNAQRLTALAEEIRVAPAWDSAAEEWTNVLLGTEGGSLEAETRYQMARARYRAWQGGASEKRTTRAREAIDGYLAMAPRGAQRDSVERWRAAVGK